MRDGCRWCGGGLTWIVVRARRWTACMRCDTSVRGDGEGPPRFTAIWNGRRADLESRGSEESES